MNARIMKRFIVGLVLFLLVGNVWSAGPPGGIPGGGPPGGNPNYCKQFPNAPGCATVPIDEHIVILLILGCLLGIYSFNKNSRLIK